MKSILFIMLLLPALAFGQTDSIPSYKIYSVSKKQEITLEKLLTNLQKKDVIFFGEEHDDSIAHMLEYELLKGLYKHRGEKNIMLSMEMFQSDVQLILDEYRNGLISKKSFEQQARVWSNYSDYRPIVAFAKENGLYILAANAPDRYTNRVAKHGLKSLEPLSNKAKSFLAPLPIDTLTGRYYEKFTEEMGEHAGASSMKLYQAQNLWDATMAWHIAGLLKTNRNKKQVLHLNGRFHSDEKLGTYAQLKHYTPRLKITNISVFKDSSIIHPQWVEWKNLGDYIIITKPAKLAE